MNTLNQFLIQHSQEHTIPSELMDTIQSIIEACIDISAQIRLGALAGILGEAGTGNIQGEQQKKLDIIANNILIQKLKKNPVIAGMASEEEDSYVSANKSGKYLVLFDPLDGSSNIDVNISIGTIFSVLAKTSSETLNTQHFLQTGNQQLAAGYVLYGPQTLLVLTFKHGVYMFTLNADNQFIQNKKIIQIPEQTSEFAINMSNQRHWEEPIKKYITELLAGETGIRGKNYNMRWVGSMVAEVHRILTRGGIFLYPKDARTPSKPGKLRLMYEANPLGLIVEQAGGLISNTHQSILNIQPVDLHQRVAVILGSKEEIIYSKFI